MSKLLRAWKQADGGFKVAAVVLLVALVVDTAVTAVSFGRVDVFLRLDMLAVLAVATVFYIFFMPLMMVIIQRDMRRGRADAVDFALLLLLYHITTTNMFRLALTHT
jgi:hypothetical protein